MSMIRKMRRDRQPKKKRMSEDAGIVWGLCTWWGSIRDVGRDGSLPVCPFCESPLYECDDEEQFLGNLRGHFGETPEFTRAFVEWCRHPTPCSRTRDEAMGRYRAFLDRTGR